MTVIEIEDFLKHHGVKGMKWGIRNAHVPHGKNLVSRMIDNRGAGLALRKQVKNQMITAKGKQSSIKIDEAPWSNYKESDYTPAQWHNASLIHDHPPGVPTTKQHCKLPVKTPSGVVNRHGVAAAAGALAGSRGGVQATSEQKAAAATALRNLYSQMGTEPPPSLKHDDVLDFLEHHGVKGMHWGIRHDPKTGRARSGKSSYSTSSEAKAAAKLRSRPVSSLSNQELKTLNERGKLEQNYHRLNPSTIKKGEHVVKRILEVGGMVGGMYALFNSPLGKKALALGSRHAARQLQLPGFRY
jgi:hypothetical protein